MTYILLFLSVVAGFLLALFLRKKKLNLLPLFLAFSGAFLLSITVFELLPFVFEKPSKILGLYIILGMVLQIILEFFSKGAEHGHVHFEEQINIFPWLLFLSLCVHSLLEGFPISNENHLLLGIIVHKIPIAFILSIFFIRSRHSTVSIVFFLTIFAVMSPLGNYFSKGGFSFFTRYSTEITALAIGVFFHVSTTILLESSKNHKFNLKKMCAVLLAIAIAYFL